MGAVGILSDQSFASLQEAVCEPTLKGIADMGFTHMTAIQVNRPESKCPVKKIASAG
jgi:hypothetical protein